MSKYKVTASKDQKKYSFILNASTIIEAKNKVHEQWYSILDVEEIDESKLIWKRIVFKAIKDWKIKSWKVVWNDLFKIYLKLKDWLWYDIKELYYENDLNISQKEKEKLIFKLIEQYNLYHELNSKKKKIKSKSESFKDKQENNWKTNTESFYLKKELEQNYKLLNFVLEKLRKLLENNNIEKLDFWKIQKLKKIYNSLVLLKTSTNISKIKSVSEAALLKIWEIELYLIEEKKDLSSEKLLKETNFLLKKLWSKEQFIPRDKNINFIIQKNIDFVKTGIINYFKLFKKKKKNIDKKSSSFLSTMVSIRFYEKKLKQNNIKILKNFYVFIFPFFKFKEQRDKISIERRLINSNLILLKSKIDKKNFSYTKLKKGYTWFVDKILLFFKNIRLYLFLVIFFYSLLFLIILLFSYYNIFNFWYLIESINYRGIFYFIVFLIIYFAMYFSRWIYSLIINFILVFVLLLFWIINF